MFIISNCYASMRLYVGLIFLSFGVQGEEISATVFGNDVKMYDKNVQQNIEYEISNAKLRPVRKENKKKPNEVKCNLHHTQCRRWGYIYY